MVCPGRGLAAGKEQGGGPDCASGGAGAETNAFRGSDRDPRPFRSPPAAFLPCLFAEIPLPLLPLVIGGASKGPQAQLLPLCRERGGLSGPVPEPPCPSTLAARRAWTARSDASDKRVPNYHGTLLPRKRHRERVATRQATRSLDGGVRPLSEDPPPPPRRAVGVSRQAKSTAASLTAHVEEQVPTAAGESAGARTCWGFGTREDVENACSLLCIESFQK